MNAANTLVPQMQGRGELFANWEVEARLFNAFLIGIYRRSSAVEPPLAG